MSKPVAEEIGDLFVSETELTVKLMPSRKSASRSIRWFSGGHVTSLRGAAQDISCLIGRLRGRGRVVRRLTVATDRGAGHDLQAAGISRAVRLAGFEILC